MAIAAATCPALAAAQTASLPTAGLPVSFGADEVRFDARSQGLVAAGNVHVDEPPFHLTSDELRLRRVRIGVVLDGDGKVAFCPCLGTPLAVRFRSATVAPPHDLVLRDPVLEVFGVPVAWAPAFWLRSPGRVGILSPEVAWRGADGLFAGEGVHVPWTDGDVAEGLDLRAGGYFRGGVDARLALRTSDTDTHVRWDWLGGSSGVDVVARGATDGHDAPTVAWDVDALRGARAVQSTTDVGVAAYPFDRAEAQTAWTPGGWLVASGVRAVSPRGSESLDAIVGGPVVAVGRGDALGNVGAYHLTLEGGAVSGAAQGTTSFARTQETAFVAGHVGPAVATVSAYGYGDVADAGNGSAVDGAAQARATLGLALARAYGAADDPWIHTTEPSVEGAVLGVHEGGVFVVPAARGMQTADGVAWVAAGRWSNALGRWGGSRSAGELDASAGLVGDAAQTVVAARARLVVAADWVGVRGEAAAVVGPGGSRPQGDATVAQVRLGPGSGLHLSANVAGRDGVDPVLARALVEAPLAPATGYLDSSGWTGGARVALPLGPRVTVRGGADADLTPRSLVAALASLELHDPCGCVVVRASASHRIARDGIDAWVTVDLPSAR